MWCRIARSALRSVGTPRSVELRRKSSRSPAWLLKVCRDSAGREFAGDEHHREADARDRPGSGEEHPGEPAFDVGWTEGSGLAEGVGEREGGASRHALGMPVHWGHQMLGDHLTW